MIIVVDLPAISIESLRDRQDPVIVVSNSLIYLALGLTVFRICERHAKRKNLIGMC